MINKDLVEKVSELARLGITEEEKAKYTEQISDIFKYFEEIKGLDLTQIEQISQITGLKNVVRDDEVHLIYSIKKLMREAPEVEGEQVKVPGVMKGKK